MSRQRERRAEYLAIPVDSVVQDFLDKTTPKWVTYLDSLKKQKIEEREKARKTSKLKQSHQLRNNKSQSSLYPTPIRTEDEEETESRGEEEGEEEGEGDDDEEEDDEEQIQTKSRSDTTLTVPSRRSGGSSPIPSSPTLPHSSSTPSSTLPTSSTIPSSFSSSSPSTQDQNQRKRKASIQVIGGAPTPRGASSSSSSSSCTSYVQGRVMGRGGEGGGEPSKNPFFGMACDVPPSPSPPSSPPSPSPPSPSSPAPSPPSHSSFPPPTTAATPRSPAGRFGKPLDMPGGRGGRGRGARSGAGLPLGRSVSGKKPVGQQPQQQQQQKEVVHEQPQKDEQNSPPQNTKQMSPKEEESQLPTLTIENSPPLSQQPFKPKQKTRQRSLSHNDFTPPAIYLTRSPPPPNPSPLSATPEAHSSSSSSIYEEKKPNVTNNKGMRLSTKRDRPPPRKLGPKRNSSSCTCSAPSSPPSPSLPSPSPSCQACNSTILVRKIQRSLDDSKKDDFRSKPSSSSPPPSFPSNKEKGNSYYATSESEAVSGNFSPQGSENDASLSVNSFYAATENDAFSANLSYLGSSQGEGKKKKKKKRTKKKGLEPLPVDWSCGNWNARFQDIMDQLDEVWNDEDSRQSLREHPLLNEELLELSQDFVSSAKMYGRIIILERFLKTKKQLKKSGWKEGRDPQLPKTIDPVSLGGVAGGDKYIVNNIVFKFAVDSHGIYGGDHWAAKAAGLELLGFGAYFNANIPGMSLPLIALVDFMGFRLIAESELPISRQTIAYGSWDGAQTVFNSNEYFSMMMDQAASRLGLCPHLCGEQKVELTSCTDAEGHIGKDGRFYLVDLARAMPPTPPTPGSLKQDHGLERSLLCCSFRPEFVAYYAQKEKPLCPDTYSRFILHDPKFQDYQDDVQEAFNHLQAQMFPRILDYLFWTMKESVGHEDSMWTCVNAPMALHQSGVNLRYLGRLCTRARIGQMRSHQRDAEIWVPVLSILYVEATARVIKNLINEKLRQKMEEFKLPLEAPYRKLVISELNLYFGSLYRSSGATETRANARWGDVQEGLKTYFAFDCEEELGDEKPEYFEADFVVAVMRENLQSEKVIQFQKKSLSVLDWCTKLHSYGNMTAKCLLFRRLVTLTNLEVAVDTSSRFLHGNDGYDRVNPLGLVDLKEIMVRVKDMNIVANAQANFEFNNAKRISSSTPKTALRLYASAEKKYLEVLSSNPNDIQTNLNLAETLRSKMTLIKKVEKVARGLDESDPDYKRAETAYRNVHPETRMGYKVGDDAYWRLMYGQFLWDSGGRMDRAEHQLLKCIQIAPACPRYIQVYAGFMAAMAEREPQLAKEYIEQTHLFSIRAQVVKLLRKRKTWEEILQKLSISHEDLWNSCGIRLGNNPPSPPSSPSKPSSPSPTPSSSPSSTSSPLTDETSKPLHLPSSPSSPGGGTTPSKDRFKIFTKTGGEGEGVAGANLMKRSLVGFLKRGGVKKERPTSNDVNNRGQYDLHKASSARSLLTSPSSSSPSSSLHPSSSSSSLQPPSASSCSVSSSSLSTSSSSSSSGSINRTKRADPSSLQDRTPDLPPASSSPSPSSSSSASPSTTKSESPPPGAGGGKGGGGAGWLEDLPPLRKRSSTDKGPTLPTFLRSQTNANIKNGNGNGV